VTNTSDKKEPLRQPKISSKKILVSRGTGGNSSRSTSSSSSSQLSTPYTGGSTKNSTMVGENPTIRLPKFHGEVFEDPKKHLFIYENIWEDNKITYEDTKLAQFAITFKDRAPDWYMSLIVNAPQGAPTTITYVNKELINEF
jgi:hypothetical protein